MPKIAKKTKRRAHEPAYAWINEKRATVFNLPAEWEFLNLAQTARETWLVFAFSMKSGEYAMIPFYGETRRRGVPIRFDREHDKDASDALVQFAYADYPGWSPDWIDTNTDPPEFLDPLDPIEPRPRLPRLETAAEI